jgi:hypothetical protein
MTFVDQIKKIGKAVGVDVAGSNIADCLNSLERGVTSKTAVPETPRPEPTAEPTPEPTPRRSRRERTKAE